MLKFGQTEVVALLERQLAEMKAERDYYRDICLISAGLPAFPNPKVSKPLPKPANLQPARETAPVIDDEIPPFAGWQPEDWGAYDDWVNRQKMLGNLMDDEEYVKEYQAQFGNLTPREAFAE